MQVLEQIKEVIRIQTSGLKKVKLDSLNFTLIVLGIFHKLYLYKNDIKVNVKILDRSCNVASLYLASWINKVKDLSQKKKLI